MFSSFTTRLREEVNTLQLVLDTHDRLRSLIFRREGDASELQVSGPIDSGRNLAVELDAIRADAPSKSNWHVYDHCAALTRLYAVYEQFVESLVSEYLRMLPELYPAYTELPVNVATQHRLGIAQVLMKLGKDGPYKELDERLIIKDLSHGLLGNANYKLLKDAFLIDPQNYRAEVLTRLLSYLGFENSWAWVERHPLMIGYMQRNRDQTETPKTVLHDFVKYRNEAAHTLVRDTLAIDQIKSISDFIVVLCDVLAQLVMKNVAQRKKALGELAAVGVVVHRFSNQIVGVRTFAGSIAVGDSLIVMGRRSCFSATVLSIETQKTAIEKLDIIEGQEIGIALSSKVDEGSQLFRPASTPQITTVQEVLSPDDFPIEVTDAAPTQSDP